MEVRFRQVRDRHHPAVELAVGERLERGHGLVGVRARVRDRVGVRVRVRARVGIGAS